jgi:hypothetical protein
MEIEEIIFRVKKNKMTKVKGVTFISDFLGTTKEEAREIYEYYIEKEGDLDNEDERCYN